MVHILNALTSLENKFDNLAIGQGGGSSSERMTRALAAVSSLQPSEKIARVGAELDHDLPSELHQSYQHLTAPHKVLLWPRIYTHLTNSGNHAAVNLQHIHREGTPWFIRQEMKKHPHSLPTDPGMPGPRLDDSSSEEGYSKLYVCPSLTIQQSQEYTDAYFNTFNVICPILDYDTMNEVVARLSREGYADCDPQSVVALLVYSLGQLAIEGVFGDPISSHNGVPSGFRGGTAKRPPGLETFNEARRRLGFVMSACTIENVQILLLQATYYEANSRNLDFWRCAAEASMAMQVLVRCEEIDWQSQSGDMIKRAYWTCVLNEDLYHLELDLPQAGICTLEDEVPLPSFYEIQDSQGRSCDSGARLQYNYHFIAMIAIRKLINRINAAVHECTFSSPLRSITINLATATSAQAGISDAFGGPSVHVVRELARQLDSWRSLLPRPLQWLDSDMFDFPNLDPTSRRPNEPLFSPDRGSVPIGHKYNLDVVIAQLRTRFCYARFMLYRPFVYKALHFPELMTADDANCCALAIQSCCLWPISMAPPKNKKRLVPHLFTWTHNFMGMLLILRMTQENGLLRQICEEQINPEDMKHTATLMLEWIRDAKQVDGVADWGWRILEPMFAGGRAL